jgi:GAF domain-containing protein
VNDQDEHDLHLRLTQLGRSLRPKPVPIGPFTMTVDDVVAIVQVAEYAAVTLVEDDRTLNTLAWNHSHALRLDEIQRELRQGPSIRPSWDSHVLRVDDLTADARWPAFRSAALAQTPVRSILVCEIFTARELVGTLSLYAGDPGVFDAQSVALGAVCAAHLASSMDVIRRRDELLRDLAGDEVDRQAKDMLMQRFEIDAATATRLLDRLNSR